MLTDTQISSHLIPAAIWNQGYPDRLDLPPISRPARDALDIERRAQKDVRLRNEAHRYVLCCERMQGIAKELSDAGVLAAAIVWTAHRFAEQNVPTALAYLAAVDTISRALRRSPYPRLSATFFPPDDAPMHMKIYAAMSRQPNIDQVFVRASRSASVGYGTVAVTPEQCKSAFERRHDLLKAAASGGYGLIDVLELV